MTGVEQRRVGQLHLHRHLGARRRGRAQHPLEGHRHLGGRLPRGQAHGEVRSRHRRHDRARLPHPDAVHVERGLGPGALVELPGRAPVRGAPADPRDHVLAGGQLLPGMPLGVGGRRDTGTELAAERPVGSGEHLPEHVREHVGGVQHRAAVDAGVQVPLAGADLQRRGDQAARGGGDGRGVLVHHHRVEHHRAVGGSTVLADPAHGRAGAHLLLALHQEAHVHGQFVRAGHLAGHVEQREEVPLVVRRASRIEATVALLRLEGRALPVVERTGMLNVVVPVGQHGGCVRPRGAELPHHHRMAPVETHQLGLAARIGDALADPLGRSVQRLLVAPAGGHRRDAKEVDQLLE